MTTTSILQNYFNLFNDGFDTFSFDTKNYNFSETDIEYVFEYLVPGFEKDELKISFENSFLTISSDVKKENIKWFNKQFKQSFKFNRTVDEENISADLLNGVLKISLPKKNSSSKITIK